MWRVLRTELHVELQTKSQQMAFESNHTLICVDGWRGHGIHATHLSNINRSWLVMSIHIPEHISQTKFR